MAVFMRKSVSPFRLTCRHAVIALALLCTTLNHAQTLPRKGWFGARIVPDPAGIRITEVVGGTSANAKLQKDDIVTAIAGRPVTSPQDVVDTMARSGEGDKITLALLRGGKKTTVSAKVAGRPRSTDPAAEVLYDRVAFKGGYLSVIINKPAGNGTFPAVLFVPGYTCSSIDGLPADHPYERVARAFSAAGFVVVRVEKSGLGDSRDTPDCRMTTLTDEVESFKAGFEKMKSLPYVNAGQLFIFGHSMGGIIAPAISASENVKGVIVYGTTAKSWFEYQLEMNRLQLKLAHTPPLEYESKCRIQGEIAYDYFIAKKPLESIAADPAKAEVLKTDWQYDGNSMIFERNQEYWRQIQDYPLLENWKNTKAQVLVLFGESDFQAFSKADHEQIVDLVNHYHPGGATLVTFPETDHYLARSGSMQQAFDLFSGGHIKELFEAFNPEVTRTSVEWAQKILR